MGALGQFPKQPLSASFFLFHFEKFLLFKPATPFKGLTSQTVQLSNQTGTIWVRVHHCPALLSWCPQSQWVHTVPTSSLLPPCDFKKRGLFPCCSNLVWQGREPLTWLSSKNLAADLVGTGSGAAATLVPMLVLGTLLSQSTLFTV